ncbi:MAG TPA: hypothetical protein VG389_01100 [Myxococcota bacterium]|nr:hypothetical protein [Myxococcota bacterium]
MADRSRLRARAARPALAAVLAAGLALAGCASACGGAERAAGTAASAPTAPGAPAAPGGPTPAGWCRGSTHVHSGNSGDSTTPPEEVAAWYERAGADFIVFTDHNFVTELPGWTGHLAVAPGVEITRNVRLWDPVRGAPGELVPMHVNALFVAAGHGGPLPPVVVPPDTARADVYAEELALATSLGGLPSLNHPTFHSAVDAALFARLAAGGLRFFEVGNASIDVHNEGEDGGPSTDALWDVALDGGATVWGLASDDAHHYADADAVEATGEPAFRPGRGWIMVHAATCAPPALRAAMDGGDFYATTGPLLTAVERGAGEMRLAAAAPSTFRFVGPGGATLSEVHGTEARYRYRRGDLWVRAVVEDAAGRRAWVQPVRPSF